MGRPKAANPKSETVQVRLDRERLAALDRIVEERQAALRGEGVEVTRASVLRGLLDREIDAQKAAQKGKAKR